MDDETQKKIKELELRLALLTAGAQPATDDEIRRGLGKIPDSGMEAVVAVIGRLRASADIEAVAPALTPEARAHASGGAFWLDEAMRELRERFCESKRLIP